VVGDVADRADEELDDGDVSEQVVTEGALGLGHPVDEAVVRRS
jgi:hypothetical protein